VIDALDQLIDEEWIASRFGLDRDSFHRLHESKHSPIDLEPNGLFDAQWYRHQHLLAPEQSPLTHYIEEGWPAGHHPGPYFDTDEYLRNRPPQDDEPLGHFLRRGRREGRVPIRPSDDNLRRLVTDTRAHHVLESISRWCTSHHMLDEEWYAWHNDLDDPSRARHHYWTIGCLVDARPSLYFDPGWYREHYRDVRESGLMPFVHFVMHGWNAGYSPSPYLNAGRFQQHMGPELPFESIRTTDIPAGVIAPLYPGGIPALSADVDAPRRWPVKPLAGTSEPFDATAVNVHWIIPDFGHGGGGHANIFKLAAELQRRGHPQHIWIDQATLHGSEAALRLDAMRWYDFFGEIGFLSQDDQPEGDVVVATSWQSAQRVRHLDRFRRRFYFVQDYEPWFYPQGTQALQADATYCTDFDFFCGSPWLASKIADEVGAWTTHFLLVPDSSVYSRVHEERQNKPLRIVAYAREHTTRRCVDLLQSALTELACRGVAFQLYAFGISPHTAGAWRNLGVPVQAVEQATPVELAEQYHKSDLGIALSSTNYSQVPPEMMACGLPVVDLDLEATSHTYPAGAVTLAKPDATSLADQIEGLLGDRDARYTQAEIAHRWVADLSWSRVADHFIATAIERIGADTGTVARVVNERPRVTVAIPTLNGRQDLPVLMNALHQQDCPWPFEILVIDSESDDGTADRARELGARTIEIARSTFQHGRTRNFAVSQAQGEFVAFLTQDAIPANNHWLRELVEPMIDDSTIAGCFGRHVAHFDASIFTEMELAGHFKGFDAHPAVVSCETDRARYDDGDPGWRQFLYFYSDNNSCLRKSVWQQFPYPAVRFGEDQAWARTIIDAGLRKAFVRDAVVRHSHDFDPEEARFRAWEEAFFFADHFNYLQIPSHKVLAQVQRDQARRVRKLGEERGVDPAMIDEQLAIVHAKFDGALYGSALRGLPASSYD